MNKQASPGLQAIGPQFQALGTAVGESMKTIADVTVPPDVLSRLQTEYVTRAAELWNDSLTTFGARSKEGKPLPDRRFSSEAWAKNPTAAMAAQLYLLNTRTLLEMADAVQGDYKTRTRIRFAIQQYCDAASPANFLALNPDALSKALQTQGESIAQGMQLLLQDIGKGRMSQTDESMFEVGRNVATTEGAVVFQNDLFQLIEYKPLTGKVHERPFLFVPPFINKYYILDLQPENSVIRYTVEQGHRVFVMSWRNPDASMAAKTWDDYIQDGAIKAIEVVRSIGGTETVNTLGFCVGGTLLATALAVLAARGQHPAHSVTLLTTLLDFTDTGVLDVFIDEPSVQLREMTIGAAAPSGPGMLTGKELATTFSFLRPNDLVWNYVVGNYLKGEAPPPFDLLYWNGDSTNLPGALFTWYLRHTYLQNDLRVPGKLTVCGEKVDIGKIKAPVFIYASREDHIVPWTSAYMSTALFKGKKRFVLGASGHIAGVINPASKNKRNYWVNDKLPASSDEWFEGATEKPGSWWTDWSGWLKPLGGAQVAAPKDYGNKQYRPIEPAPGSYVKQKA